MPKWENKDESLWDNTGCFLLLTNTYTAERLADRHNADIDALQRKLDAVLRVVKREDITYGAASEIRAILEAGQ